MPKIAPPAARRNPAPVVDFEELHQQAKQARDLAAAMLVTADRLARKLSRLARANKGVR